MATETTSPVLNRRGRSRSKAKTKLQVTLSMHVIDMLDEMRYDLGSMTRSALIEMVLRKHYFTEEATQLRELREGQKKRPRKL